MNIGQGEFIHRYLSLSGDMDTDTWAALFTIWDNVFGDHSDVWIEW